MREVWEEGVLETSKKSDTISNAHVSGASLPQSGSLNMAAFFLLRAFVVPGLHGGGEGGMVHGFRQHHVRGTGHLGVEVGEERVRPLRTAFAQAGRQGVAGSALSP